jgi:hypothetical protein
MSDPRERSRRIGTPELAIVLVLALLVGGSLLLGGGGDSGATAVSTVSPERLARVERRVEALRGLRFVRPVRVEVLTPEQVRAFGVAETEKESPRAQQDASEELLKLLGLVRPKVDLDAVTSDIYGEQVAGFYDPRSERMALVEGVGIDDVTLAHELTHALEDQHFDLERLGNSGRGVAFDGDAATAETGLVEGTATLVMTQYLQRYPSALSFGDALGQMWGAASARPLPPAIMRSLLFSYEAGERFARRLHDTTGDWRLIDNALRDRPPVSSAELYDPERWLRVVRPDRVPAPAPGAPGAGWRRIYASTFGEADLRELLHDSEGERKAGAIGSHWSGGRIVLWRRGPLPDAGCAAPCRASDALALRIRVDSPQTARRLQGALLSWVWLTLDGTDVDANSDVQRVGQDGLARIVSSGREVRVALAPDADVLERLLR